jgi:2-C-methyl-D-erythritol 2,4-cyclodiphosphate synthase
MVASTRVGIGYDVHSLKAGRRLVLGGVVIPFDKGLDGWSDADVLIHAIMDAMLGAAALGDIGTHFPPGSKEYKDISSLALLSKVKEILDSAHWRIGNLDATIMAEAPRLKDYMPVMARNIARVLCLLPSEVSVKAGTGERMGFIGRGEGIAAQAVALLETAES